MATQTNVAMVSETSICNQALSWLGCSEIRSLADAGKSAEWMRNNYAFLRNAVLEEGFWTFATARKLSETSDLDEWGIQYSHPKPLNWISVPRCYRDVSSPDPREWKPAVGWRVEGEYVLAYEDTVYMWGTQIITDTAKFSPMFVQALAARLAADAAIPLTQDPTLQATMWGLYEAKVSISKTSDGLQGKSDKVSRGNMVGRRLGGGN